MPVKKHVTYQAWCDYCRAFVGIKHDTEVKAFSDMAIHRNLHSDQYLFDLEDA